MNGAMNWFSAPKPEGTKLPEWARSYGIAENGQVFVPAAIGGKESDVVMCLGYEGTEHRVYLDHTFVPADWLASEFPESRELCEKIVMDAQAHIRANTATKTSQPK